MPTPYIEKLSREGKGSLESLEKKWDEAKKKAADEGKSKDWAYVTTIFKSMVGANYAFAHRLHAYYEVEAAGGIIVAADTGRFNFCLRGAGVDDPNVWGTWGGSVDRGELPEETARRELAEEAGYTGPLKTIPLYRFEEPGFTYYNYALVVPHEFHPDTNWENKTSRWVEFDDWPKPLHPGCKALLSDAKSLAVLRKFAKPLKASLRLRAHP